MINAAPVMLPVLVIAPEEMVPNVALPFCAMRVVPLIRKLLSTFTLPLPYTVNVLSPVPLYAELYWLWKCMFVLFPSYSAPIAAILFEPSFQTRLFK